MGRTASGRKWFQQESTCPSALITSTILQVRISVIVILTLIVFKTELQSGEDPAVINSDLMQIQKYMSGNKYIVEALFENVLLNSQMLNQRFASFNEAEKKILFEALVLNPEFKEYIFTKVQKDEIARAMQNIKADLQLSNSQGFDQNGVQDQVNDDQVQYDSKNSLKQIDEPPTEDIGNQEIQQENAV